MSRVLSPSIPGLYGCDGRFVRGESFGPLSGTLIEKYDARYALDPNDLAVAGNPWGVPNFLWIDDGSGATIGPAGLNMAAVGTVTAGQPTPHQYPDGTDALMEVYAGASYRRDLGHTLEPADSNDIIMVVKYRYSDAVNLGTRYLFHTSTRGTNGFGLSLTGGSFSSYQTDTTWTERESGPVVACSPRSMHMGGFIMNRDGNTYGYADGVQGAAVATLAGEMVGNGIAIGCDTAATGVIGAGACVEWIAAWYADGLYETWIADSARLMKRIHAEAMGLRETITNSKYWSFSDIVTGTSYKDHNDRWWFASKRTPRAGNPNGCILSPYSMNGAIAGASGVFNYNPAGVAGWTVTGGVFAVAADTAALAAVKANTWGPNVYSFTNATGVPQTVYVPQAPVINTVCHLMVLARYVAGANALIGWWDASDAAFTSVGTILDSYAVTAVYAQTALQADWYFAIQIPDGCELRFIGHAQLRDSGRIVYPPPYKSTPWGNNVSRNVVTTEHTPVAGQGSYLAHLAPLGWGGTALGVDNSVLPCVTTAGDILHAESAAPGWATGDGTTQIAVGAPVAGTYVDVWSAWKAALQYIQQGLLGVATTGAYDGTKGTAGALTAAPSTYGGDFALKYIEIRNVA